MAIHEKFYTNQHKEIINFYNENDSDSQVQFIIEVAALKPSMKVLDLACGYGRHSISLARRGFDVTGYDYSSDYIQLAKDNAAAEDTIVKFEQFDMKQLASRDCFDTVLSLSTSLSFYDDSINKNIIARIHNALKPDGIFVFDQGNIFTFSNQDFLTNNTGTKELSDKRIHYYSYTFDAIRCVLSRRSKIQSSNGTETTGWDLRYYTLPEITAITEAVGFETISVYGNYDLSAYNSDSKRMIIILRKV